MYGVDLAVQIENLMPALGLGFILGLLSDAFRFLRLSFFRSKAVLFVFDTVFVVTVTLASFLMCLAVNHGKIRMYLILAEAVGAGVYFCSLGVLSERLIKAVSGRISRLISVPMRFVRKIGKFLIKNLKKIKINSKKPLQEEDEVVYNNNNC